MSASDDLGADDFGADEFDLIVLGLGSGGEEVANRTAEAGWRVAGIDAALVGGECPYYGCIPSKIMLRGAEMLAEARRVTGIAGHADVSPDLTPVADRIRDEATDNWNDAAAVKRFEGFGGTFVRGSGVLHGRDPEDRFVVTVGERTYRAPNVVVATGTAPAIPPIDGLRELRDANPELVWTNREAVKARTAPESLVVIGGGAIGCELAQGFARFGSRTTVIEAAPRLLMPEEPEAGAVIADVFAREGIDVHTGFGVQRVSRGGDGAVVEFADGSSVTGATLLIAAGRAPNLHGIGLPSVGLADDLHALDVDEHLTVLSGGTAVDGLYAVGDITGRGAFTHVAFWQAGVLVDHLLGRPENFGGYHGLAWATFTDPEVGRVGKTQEQAEQEGLRLRVGGQQISANSRGWMHGPGNDGFIKVVEDAERGVLVGATVVAPNGGEILGLLTLAVHAAVPTSTLASMHYAFPTMHRGVLEAVRALA